MTFSLIARDEATGMFGIGIATSSIAVGNRCPWARARIGAVTSQHRSDIRLGPKGLDFLAAGLSAEETVRRLIEESEFPDQRQVAAIDREGRTAFFSGPKIPSINAGHQGRNCVSTGNVIANPDVPKAMVDYFEGATDVPFVEKLLGAIDAGLTAGGETQPIMSAALLVVDEQDWPLVDLRVDLEPEPQAKLRELWKAYEPQVEHFVVQVLRPNEVKPRKAPEQALA
ncbi:Uncharacterized conserved protein, Ntn-hydrolase superfamily [Bosea sp. CRIB-10]|uniref:DUF1028 domain-containing protein n=1 Tax=Bosea sp. CRIB-10 TaxID=378404 RepID=UPI0008EED0E9|nr:DUF1028 domain-containing protein [Bosea sp. CRIB-10]SFC56323.1 Uncharacterized conserved protein, Ntn-hydrolase superfamily [Bosea sp. CRIB-10]